MESTKILTQFQAKNIHTGESFSVKKMEILTNSKYSRIGEEIVFEFETGERWNEILFNTHFVVMGES